MRTAETYLEVVAAFENALLNGLDEVATEVEQSEAPQAVELAARKDGVEIITEQVVRQAQFLQRALESHEQPATRGAMFSTTQQIYIRFAIEV